MRLAHVSSADFEPAIDMRKGEPKVNQRDWPVNIQGKNIPDPELPHATSTPSGSLPAGNPLPLSCPVHLRQSYSGGCRRTDSQSSAAAPGGRPIGFTL
jgi:hypothetical protein